MIRVIVAALVSLISSLLLTACVTTADVQCKLIDGVWFCTGGVGGNSPDAEQPQPLPEA